MELQFKKQRLSCLRRAARHVSAQELVQEVRLPDGMPDIGRVLSAWGQIIIRSKEWHGDTVTVAGGAMVWILYAPEDGTDPRCIDTWIPYQLSWEHLDADMEGPVRISPLLRFVDARTVSARKFMVRAGAAALAEAHYPGETEFFTPDEVPTDVQLLRRTYPVRLPKEAGEKTFQLDEELTVPGSDIEHIISYTFRAEISDIRVLANKLVFRGNGKLHLVYCCREGRIRTFDFDVPFSQFAELENSYSPDAGADIWFAATLLELDLEDSGQLRLKCGLVAQYLVDDRELVDIVEDAYSPRRSVGVLSERLVLPSVLEDRTENVGISQTAQIHGGEVVDANFLPDFPRQRQTPEGVEMEIPGIFQVLYYGEDGTLQSANTRWEKRMEIPAGDSCRIDTHIMTKGGTAAAMAADGTELSGQLLLQCRSTSDGGMQMVTGLEIGELHEADPGRPSLILCRSEGEDLWDIAKRCGSTMEAIRQVNGIMDEISPKRILLIPVG